MSESPTGGIEAGSVMTVKSRRLLGAAGRARSAHIVQLGAVGVERLGEERAEEGPDPGEELAVPVTAVRGGGEGSHIDDRHDESCLFSGVF